MKRADYCIFEENALLTRLPGHSKRADADWLDRANAACVVADITLDLDWQHLRKTRDCFRSAYFVGPRGLGDPFDLSRKRL